MHLRRTHTPEVHLGFPVLFISFRGIHAALTSRTASGASPTAPAALSVAKPVKLAAHNKKHRDRQNRNNNNICHTRLLPFLFR